MVSAAFHHDLAYLTRPLDELVRCAILESSGLRRTPGFLAGHDSSFIPFGRVLKFRVTRLPWETIANCFKPPLSGIHTHHLLSKMRKGTQAPDDNISQPVLTGYGESFKRWRKPIPSVKAELQLLSFIRYIGASSACVSPRSRTESWSSDPDGPRLWDSKMIRLSGTDRSMNQFSVERIGEQTKHNLVLLPGYGSGLAFFYKNLEVLSREPGWKVYALDWLGMGRSTRPPFAMKARTRQDQVVEAEAWFVDSLEEWRQINRIDKMTLLGHSFGGYMAVVYALKYPGHLNKLILVSPVGIVEDANQSETTTGHSLSTDDNNHDRRLTRPIPRGLTYMWNANITPFSLVRFSRPLGYRLVSSWVSRRFSHLPPGEISALQDYIYSLLCLSGSGEYVLSRILAPGVLARDPLINRIHRVGRQMIPPEASSMKPATVHENGIPIVFIYGKGDWANGKVRHSGKDTTMGRVAKDTINAERDRVSRTAEQRSQDRGGARIHIVKDALHHAYLENPDDFNKTVTWEMRDVVGSYAVNQLDEQP